MADLAVLGLEIRSDGAAKAASDLDKLSASANKAEKASNDLGAASEKNSTRIAGMSKASERTLAALERMEAIMRQQSQMFTTMNADSTPTWIIGLLQPASVQGAWVSGQFVHLMKLGMGRYPNVDAVVNLDVLIEAITHFYAQDAAIAYIVGAGAKSTDPIDESNAIYVAKMAVEKDHLTMLLVRGDPGRGVPAYVNPKTRRITTVRSSEPGAVRAASVHIVISKQEIADGKDQGRFRMAMEQTSGISRILARDLFGTLLAQYAKQFPEKFTAEKKRRKKGEKAEIIEYRPTIRFHPHANASLQEDLKQGKIGGFKLVRGRTEFNGEAEDPKIQRLDVSLHARIVPTEDYGKVRSLVDHLQQALEQIDFEDLKLELVDDEGSPVTLPGSISLGDDDGGADGDMRYCKKIAITGLKDVPPECHTDLHGAIVDFTVKTISNDAHWS